MVQMYIKSLKVHYDLIVSCKDYDNAENINLGVQLVPDGIQTLEAYPKLKKILNLEERIKFNIKEGKKIHFKFSIRYYRKNLMQLFNKKLYQKNTKCILAIDGETLLSAKVLSKILGIPYVYVAYEIWPNQYSYYSRDQIGTMEYLEKKYIEDASMVLVVNKKWADLIRRRYKLKNKFEIVTVAPESISNSETLNNISVSNPVKIHYHGGVFHGRGVEELVYAMRDVKGAKLYIRPVGNKDLIRELELYVQNKNLQEKIEFLEPVKMVDLPIEGMKYDVGVVIAKNETTQGRMVTGFKLFEYMSSGLAVLAPKSYPIKNIFKEKRIGIHYEETTAFEITKALQYLADNPQIVLEMKKESKKLSEEKYNYHIQCNNLLEIINKL
jgi:glycosyltransferase involved in cell wall biosynthesis